jgi:hypothetical protein
MISYAQLSVGISGVPPVSDCLELQIILTARKAWEE